MTQATLTSQTDAQNPATKIIADAIKEVSHIATLPEITVKIIQIVENPDSTGQDLHKLIANDPALCARILKVVNSAFYGLPGQIASINRAIVLLGLNAVKNIAIAASLSKMFRGGQISPNFNAKDLWNHSIAVGSAVKLLAEKLRSGLPDEAFLAGLIHDLGIIVQMQTLRQQLIDAVEKHEKQNISFLEAELAVFGVTHQDFGLALCEKWKFPRSFALVAGYHHRPLELDPAQRGLASLVYVGDILAARAKLGYAGTVASLEINPQVITELKLTQPLIDEVLAALPEAYEVASAVMAG